MRILILLLLLLFLASSCRMTLGVYDPDPLYSRRTYVRPAIPQQRYWDPNPYLSWPGYYYLDPWAYRERVIIIQPQSKPQTPAKRPSRDPGNYNPNFRPQRGRIN
jgi:hypothetical protein